MTAMATLSSRIIEFYEKISSWEHDVVKGSGLSPAQMHTIEIVGHSGRLRMKELAKKMGVTTGTLTVMVDRLEQQALLKRVPHEQDRRSFLITLTEKGQRFFGEHHQYHLQLTEEIAASLSDPEQEQFSAILEKILQRL
ncbi:MarR family winged helix-turn-helix transcriptional regulator [Thiovibrio sp. JS02]